MEKANEHRLVSRKDASELLNCSQQTISNWINNGVLKGHNIGGRLFVDANTLDVLVDKVNDIEYSVTLGISEGNFDMFKVSISVSEEIMAKKICAAFKNDPQTFYSEFLSILTKKI